MKMGSLLPIFRPKLTFLMNCFVEQCSIVPSKSVLPPLIFQTNNKLSNTAIDETEILKLICKLNIKNDHSCDELSIKMVKLCDNTIALPLCLVCEKCLASGTCPQIWKMAKVLPIHNKEIQQVKKYYRPISLLRICGKIFEKIKFIIIFVIMNYSLPINLDFVQAIQL